MSHDLNMSAADASSALDSVFADIFFSKMAEYGFVPETEEGAMSMLETAAYLDSIPGQTVAKQASADPYVEAGALLKQAMAANNLINPAVLAQQESASIKQAAYALAHEPELYKAVLALNSGAAE